MVRVLVVEPFYGGSHRAFLDGLVRHSHHDFELLTLAEGEWRQRMRRGAQELAALSLDVRGTFDVLVATDMLDLATFLALTRPRFAATPVLLYFHENQFTYPRLRGTKFNSWFGQINYLSACAADTVAFNSAFHRDDFLGALRHLAGQPNNWLVESAIETIECKSRVLPVGVELAWLDQHRPAQVNDGPPLLLWNHRWEFDKAPAMFARAVDRLAADGVDFRLVIAGEPGPNPAPELQQLAVRHAGRIAHFGYVHDQARYAELLWRSDIVVSTTRHEFFGVGMAEALYCGCIPVAPARFNYPALVPVEWHEMCLFEDEEGLVRRLAALIRGPRKADGAGRRSALRFGWEAVLPEWDAQLQAISRTDSRSGGMHDSSRMRV